MTQSLRQTCLSCRYRLALSATSSSLTSLPALSPVSLLSSTSRRRLNALYLRPQQQQQQQQQQQRWYGAYGPEKSWASPPPAPPQPPSPPLVTNPYGDTMTDPDVPYKAALTVSDIVNRPANTESEYESIIQALEQEILPFLRANPTHMSLLRRAAVSAFRYLMARKRADPANPKLLPLYHLSQLMAVVGNRDGTPRLDMILPALDYIVRSNQSISQEVREALARDVVDVWKHLSYLSQGTFITSTAPPLQDPESLGWNLPASNRVKNILEGDKGALPHDAFILHFRSIFPSTKWLSTQSSMFPQSTPVPSPFSAKATGSDHLMGRVKNLEPLAFTLLCTASILQDPAFHLESVYDAAKPLVVRVQEVMMQYQHQIDPSKINLVALPFPVLTQYFAKNWMHVAQTPDVSAYIAPGLLHKRMQRAFMAKNSREADLIWAQFENNVRMYQDRYPEEETASLIDYFLSIAGALRRYKLRTRVLEFMVEIGIKPNVRTFTAMLDGSKISRDPIMLMRQWDMATQMGIEFDTAMWTARISGLIECGKPHLGLLALKEMGDRWDKSQEWANHANDDNNNLVGVANRPKVVRPTIEPVNAAIIGLIRLNKSEAVNDVVAWANRNNIEADITTFNILLKHFLRQGKAQEVENILNVMRQRDIQPDVGTFATVASDSLSLAARAGDPAEKQVAIVRDSFAQVEALGLVPNQIMYGGMIFALSKGGAEEAIEAVREYMRDHNVLETPHIKTILAERKLSLNEPQVPEILEMVRRRDEWWLSRMDTVFWERAMCTLAAAGNVSEALELFYWLHDAERMVSLAAMRNLLSATVDKRFMDEAQKVVDAAQHLWSLHRSHTHGRSQRGRAHGFWVLARQHGLIRE